MVERLTKSDLYNQFLYLNFKRTGPGQENPYNKRFNKKKYLHLKAWQEKAWQAEIPIIKAVKINYTKSRNPNNSQHSFNERHTKLDKENFLFISCSCKAWQEGIKSKRPDGKFTQESLTGLAERHLAREYSNTLNMNDFDKGKFVWKDSHDWHVDRKVLMKM